MQHIYRNPVYPFSCPDPFVLKYCNEYWCYFTGFTTDGRCFGILHSRDLVQWRELPGAMERLNADATCYWAPEVIYDNGHFLMYYSVGNEEEMQIRVATATHPAGPFEDCGVRLTTEEFAIDAHVFIDDDGTRWLFYATDFLTHTHIGTGTVCDRMLDPFTLARQPQPVTRARFDWQIYDPARQSKGGVRWHTVEGPFVLKRKNRYYQIFSAGNWQQASYGVSYAISDRLLMDGEWEQAADGERILPILRTIPGHVLGPGHNSVVRGPDNQQLYCIYHRWTDDVQARVLAIDPLDWAGDRILILGPSYTAQPLPTAPLFADYFDTESVPPLRSLWSYDGGNWQRGDGVLRQVKSEEQAAATCSIEQENFLVEVSLRLLPDQPAAEAFGLKLRREDEDILLFNLLPQTGQAVLAVQLLQPWQPEHFDLPASFDFQAFHLLRVELNGPRVRVSLDGNVLQWSGKLNAAAHRVVLTTSNAAAEFAGFALTGGWEDSFLEKDSNPSSLGWNTTANDDRWRIGEQHLWFIGPHGEASILTKGPLPTNYELVINARLMSEPEAESGYGFYPALSAESASPLLTVEKQETGWALWVTTEEARRRFVLPRHFDPAATQQFRFRKEHARLTLAYEDIGLGEIEVPAVATMVGLYGLRAIVAFDLVRVTALGSEP